MKTSFRNNLATLLHAAIDLILMEKEERKYSPVCFRKDCHHLKADHSDTDIANPLDPEQPRCTFCECTGFIENPTEQ